MVERREIEIFLTVGEELHFGRSAERLHVSVAMVSKTVQKLERSVGAALFERTSRRVAFTAIGRRLFEDLKPAHQAVLDAFARAVAAGRGVDGVLRVGFLGTATAEFVVRAAELLRTRHPGCEVRLHESRFTDGTAPLRDDVIDVLLIDNFAAPLSTLAPEHGAGPVLFREAPMLAVSARHPLARREAVDVAELARYEVLRPRAAAEQSVRASTPGQAARWVAPEGAERLFAAGRADAPSFPLGGAPGAGPPGGARNSAVSRRCGRWSARATGSSPSRPTRVCTTPARTWRSSRSRAPRHTSGAWSGSPRRTTTVSAPSPKRPATTWRRTPIR